MKITGTKLSAFLLPWAFKWKHWSSTTANKGSSHSQEATYKYLVDLRENGEN